MVNFVGEMKVEMHYDNASCNNYIIIIIIVIHIIICINSKKITFKTKR